LAGQDSYPIHLLATAYLSVEVRGEYRISYLVDGGHMKPIPEELVEETWEEVAGFTLDRAHKEMTRASKNQPDLVAFVMEFTQDLDQEVKELATYATFVVYRMFLKSSPKKINKISAEEIIACYEANEDLMERLEGVHEKFLDRIARVQLSGQPYVLRYVLETLMEMPEEEDPVELSEEDIGFLFLVLKTVVDVLDKTT